MSDRNDIDPDQEEDYMNVVCCFRNLDETHQKLVLEDIKIYLEEQIDKEGW